MHAAAVRLELRLPGCRSLKEKRRVLRPLLDHLRRKMELSVAEVGQHDAWQRSVLGLAVVAPQAGRLDELIESIRRWILDRPDIEVVALDVGHVEMP
jgi:uncharacterized protein YlxP (DUF503 family)